MLITLDTTRADHLSCYAPLKRPGSVNSASAKTPHLDALAARGVLFAQATVQAPVTLPSHASIMTGTYPPVHGLRDMEGFVLDKSHPTLATAMQASGFATAAFVGSRVLAKQFGLANGFTSYDDGMGGAGVQESEFAERRGSAVTDAAIAWLQKNGRTRFFLWTHYFDPHAPYDPPEPYKQTYARDLYSGEIAYADEQVGRVLTALEQLGLASNTLVAVIGDHGESLGEHGELTHGVFLYESTLHVPLILAGPGVPRGKVVHEQVRSVDLLPTLLTFVNVPADTGVQGLSLWPLIERGIHSNSSYSYSETLYPRTYMGWSELAAVRQNDWKLIVAPRPELYNLKEDPGESRNLISDHPAEAAQLRDKITDLEKVRRTRAVPASIDAKTRRQFESLGYVSGGTPRQSRNGTPAPDPKDRVKVLETLTSVEDLLSRKQYVRAAALMEEALRADPTNPRCHISLAMAYEKMGEYKRAIQVFQHALDLKIETDKIYSRLGIDYLHLGQLDKAVESMTQAISINPADLHTLQNLGMAYLQMGRVNDAEKTFRAITAMNDRHAPAHDGLGLVAIQRSDVGTARREFEKAVEIDPDDPKSLLDLGILHQNTGNGQQALHYLEAFMGKVGPGQFTDQIPAVRGAIEELKADQRRNAGR